MSTPQTEAPPAPPRPQQPRELKVYGHSTLFYWWPVWVTGYIIAAITAARDNRLAIVPEGSEVRRNIESPNIQGRRNIVLLPEDTDFPQVGRDPVGNEEPVRERVHPSKLPGLIFTVIVLLVVLITNVPLRGLSSATAVVVILLLTVTFAYFGWWDEIFNWLGRLSIHLNMGFYIFFSTALLVVWLLVFFGYDRLSFWRVRAGQITHEYVFGGGERSYATDNMNFEKLRDDLFRHWVLGFGSGDMVMYPMTAAGGTREELHISNVLLVGTKLRRIQELIAEKPDQDVR